ncbi:MAG: hypothetical protein ABIH74_05810 [Candidatus Omnitrophota bacterium]
MAEKKNQQLEINRLTRKNMPWYFNPWVITGAILSFGAFGLIPLWMRPSTKLRIKVLVSLVAIGITVWISIGCVRSYKMFSVYYEDLARIVKGS